MAQSYVGKPAISKGIGRAIRKFVAFAFSAHVPGHQRRACVVPDVQREHRTSCAARCEAFSGSRCDLLENHHLGNSKGPQAGSVLWRRTRTATACLGEGGERGCGKPSALAACDTAPGRSAADLPCARLNRADRRYN
jgi:hypothetical protein